MRRALVAVLLFCAVLLTAESKSATKAKSKSSGSTFPVTASSDQARELFEKGMVDYENLYLDRCTQEWRDAVAADPNFALAHAWIAFSSNNPAEVTKERERAKALEPTVTPGEKLMIEWIVNVQENNFVIGIAAMNDMLVMYPKDKRLLYLAGNWLMGEQEDERAGKMMERALKIDKNYPAALNDLAYAHARVGDFPPAFAAMERYIKALPNEPNPQDSYGEILRLSGNYEGALKHYRAALKIYPKFHSSQLGLGDTYALMGDEVRARAEYDKAIQQDENETNRTEYALQSAITWVRENKLEEADKAFQAVAEKAHSQGLGLQEARAHRLMAMYQEQDVAALNHLEAAEEALEHRQNISQSDREEERSRILRLRVARALHGGNKKEASHAMHQLQSMAKGSRSTVIQQSYHAAEGAMLVAQEKFSDAIASLQEDSNDPYSLELLSRAFRETGSGDDVHTVESKLRAINTPTMEQALVVIPARAKQPTN
jgi:tetratricopeptide (TPR) repeat protein